MADTTSKDGGESGAPQENLPLLQNADQAEPDNPATNSIEFPTIHSCVEILQPLSYRLSTSPDHQKWLDCNICTEEFPDLNALKAHSRMEHGKDSPFECQICFSRFKSNHTLETHIQESHQSAPSPQTKIRRTSTTSNTGEASTHNNPEIPELSDPSQPHINTEKKSGKRHLTSIRTTTSDFYKRPKPKPKSKRRLLSSSELSQCFRCKIVFPSYEEWRHHAVYTHALVKNPCPIVEMNYVDVETIREATQPSVINTYRKTGAGETNEKIRVIFCRTNGSYVIKKSNSIEEAESTPPQLVAEVLSTVTEEFVVRTELNEAGNSPGISEMRNLIASVGGGSTSPAANWQEQPEPEVESEAVSPSINKENNVPSEVETSFGNGENRKKRQKVANFENDSCKSPTSGTYIYLGNGSSESDRALANTGNSHVVIIQNDILHIGEDANEEDLQRLAVATSTNAGNPRGKALVQNPLPSTEKDCVIDNSAECILPNFIDDVEHTVMISEELRNLTVPASQIVNLALATSLSSETSISRPGNTIEIRSLTPTGAEDDDGISNSAKVPTMSPTANGIGPNNNTRAPQYETITPPLRTDPKDGNNSANPNAIVGSVGTIILGLDSRSQDDKDQNEDSDRDLGNEDDFRCRICKEVFPSEDDLDVHFSDSHFRVGIASNLLEPESPFPPTPAPAVSEPPLPESRPTFVRRSLEEPATNSNVNLNNYQPQRIANANQQMQPNVESALARQLMNEHRVPPSSAADIQSYRAVNSQFSVRPTGGNYQVPNLPGRPGPHNITMSSSALHHSMAATSGNVRPPSLSSAPNFTITQSLNSRPLTSIGMATRPQLTMGHPATNPSLQQQYLRSVNQQNQLMAQAHAMRQHQHHQHQLQIQQHIQANANATSHQNGHAPNASNSRPMPMNGVRHSSTEHDGPRIVEVTSMSRPQLHQPPQQHQHMHQGHGNQMQFRARYHGTPDYRLRGAMNSSSGTAIRQNMAAYAQAQAQKRQAGLSMPNLQDHSNPAKVARMEAYNAGLSHRGGHSQNSAISDLTITQTQRNPSPQGQGQPPSQSSPNMSILSSNGVRQGELRLGNAITLSVCPTSDPSGSADNSPSSSPGSGARQVSIISSPPSGINANSVASALAVRGVTVTPASPPMSVSAIQETANQRYPVNVSISPNPDITSRSSPISVIQRVERPHVSPTATFFPHQFAVPRNPAPRPSAPASVPDRPERPPTVDLTVEEPTPSMTSTPHPRGNPMQNGIPNVRNFNIDRRPPQQTPAATRPNRLPFTCTLCHVLFTSIQSLEEHKFERHGIPMSRQISNPSMQVRPVTPPGPIRPPQLLQMRPISPTTRPAHNAAGNNGSNRYLYIPLLDMSRMDPTKLRRLEEMGIMSVVPLHGNERATGQMGMPIVSLRGEGLSQQMPWDSVLPMGPVQTASHVASQSPAANGRDS